MKVDNTLVVLDLETTGKSTNQDQIVQIGLVRLNPDGTVDEKEFLIKPSIPISQEATKVHGLTDSDVLHAPMFKEIANELSKWFEDVDIAGYNSNNFDLLILNSEFEKVGMDFPPKNSCLIDVMKIERIVNSHRLEDTYKRYMGASIKNSHNALVDAKATFEVLKHQLEKHRDVLPQDIKSLYEFTEGNQKRVDISGKIVELNGKVVWSFGKHKHQLVSETIDYARWVLKSDFSENTKQHVRAILNQQDKSNENNQ